MTQSREVPTQGRFAPANHLGTGPFDAALRAAVRERGLTLERLRSHLARRGIRVGLSSLSDWQHGRSRPGSAKSLEAVRALEEILGLRHAALVDLLVGPDKRSENRVRATEADQLGERMGPLADLVQEFVATQSQMHVICRQVTVWVSENRHISRSNARSVIRARRDGVDRAVIRYFGEPGTRLDEVQFGNLVNCSLGRVSKHPTEPVMVAELLFDETLAAGETWVYENEILDHADAPATDYAHGFIQPEEQYILEVRFHPKALPVDCHVYRRGALTGELVRTADLTLSASNSVHLVASGLRDGVLGIAWSWS
jgi:hypothetical protein